MGTRLALLLVVSCLCSLPLCRSVLGSGSSKLSLKKKSVPADAVEDERSAKSDFASLLEREEQRRGAWREDLHETSLTEEERTSDRELWRRRYEISRRLARPVERVLRVLQGAQGKNNLHHHEQPDPYSVLGISSSSSSEEINKKYRMLAKVLHPDKNPHPDARIAFVALTKALAILSDPISRSDYDKSVVKRRRRQYTLHHVWNVVHDDVQNFHARLLLFLMHLRQGKWKDEFSSLKATLGSVVMSKLSSLLSFYYKLKFSPTLTDKLIIVGELLWSKKINLISLFFISLLY